MQTACNCIGVVRVESNCFWWNDSGGDIVTNETTQYVYSRSGEGWAHSYLVPTVLRVLKKYSSTSVFEIGCGNGYVAHLLARSGLKIVATEHSESGVAVAKQSYPEIRVEVGSAYDGLAEKYGQFSAVLSLEVVEHLMLPRAFARSVADLLEDEGIAIISTPYHGYWKNLAMALAGRMDEHFTALWDGGHIKFWSIPTLTALLSEVGLEVVECHRVGRVPALAKSMILVARKAGSNPVVP
jgi:cyclopropane fatty-acyl-phospholipid synthase-like methyltransferase